MPQDANFYYVYIHIDLNIIRLYKIVKLLLLQLLFIAVVYPFFLSYLFFVCNVQICTTLAIMGRLGLNSSIPEN